MRDCYYCDELEYGNKYKPNDFMECIKNNNQFKKIYEYKF